MHSDISIDTKIKDLFQNALPQPHQFSGTGRAVDVIKKRYVLTFRMLIESMKRFASFIDGNNISIEKTFHDVSRLYEAKQKIDQIKCYLRDVIEHHLVMLECLNMNDADNREVIREALSHIKENSSIGDFVDSYCEVLMEIDERYDLSLWSSLLRANTDSRAKRLDEVLVYVKDDSGSKTQYHLTPDEAQKLHNIILKPQADGGFGKKKFNVTDIDENANDSNYAANLIQNEKVKEEVMKQLADDDWFAHTDTVNVNNVDFDAAFIKIPVPQYNHLVFTNKFFVHVYGTATPKGVYQIYLNNKETFKGDIIQYYDRSDTKFADRKKQEYTKSPTYKSYLENRRKDGTYFVEIDLNEDWINWKNKPGVQENLGDRMPMLLNKLKMIRNHSASTNYVHNIIDALMSQDPVELSQHLFKYNLRKGLHVSIPKCLKRITEIDTFSGGGDRGNMVGKGEFACVLMFKNIIWNGSNKKFDITVDKQNWHIKHLAASTHSFMLNSDNFFSDKLQKFFSLYKTNKGIDDKRLFSKSYLNPRSNDDHGELGEAWRLYVDPMSYKQQALKKSREVYGKSKVAMPITLTNVSTATNEELKENLYDNINNDFRNFFDNSSMGVIFFIGNAETIKVCGWDEIDFYSRSAKGNNGVIHIE